VLEKVLEDELFTDVVLSVRGREFAAHRAILAARSPVFKVMFESSKDSVHNRVLIVDIRPEVIQAMLRFIYTGKVPENLLGLADGLLTASNKYRLDRLKLICSEVLSGEIGVQSAPRLLILADSTKADVLKARTIKFIAEQPRAVVQSEDWHVLKQHPQLLADLCQVLARGERDKKSGHRRSTRHK